MSHQRLPRVFPAPVFAARWDFWGLTACLFGAHSSFPPMHVYVLRDTRHDYFCTLPLRFPSTQANYAASIQQTVSAAASLLAAEVGVDSVLLPWALPVSLAGARMGGFITCVFASLVGFPPLHPYGWRKLHANIIGRSGGMVHPQVPLPDAPSLAALKGTVLGSIQGEDFV